MDENELKHLRDDERTLFEASKLDTTFIAGSQLRMFAYRLDTARRDLSRAEQWKQAVTEAAVVSWVLTTDNENDPKRLLNDLLCWEQKLALDPLVSKEAKELHERIAAAEQRAARMEAALWRQGKRLARVRDHMLDDNGKCIECEDSEAGTCWRCRDIAEIDAALSPRTTPAAPPPPTTEHIACGPWHVCTEPQPQPEQQGMEDENLRLRKLLAVVYSGTPNLYGDDGCLQDNRRRPPIDYIKDSAEEIERKMQERGRAAIVPPPQPPPTTEQQDTRTNEQVIADLYRDEPPQQQPRAETAGDSRGGHAGEGEGT